MRILIFVPFLLASVALAAQDSETFDCKSTAGFLLIPGPGVKPEPQALFAGKDGVAFRYDREKVCGLAHAALLTELRRLRLTLKSESAATVAIGISERSGAAFHYLCELPAGKPKVISVAPEDFTLNDDSPVKKLVPDPRLLTSGYALFDLSFLKRAKGPNTLTIQEVAVERAELAKTTGQWIVDAPTVLTKSTLHEGDLLIKKGGRLQVIAPRLVLRGNVTCDGGALELDNTAFVQAQRFNHERKWIFANQARLSIRNSLVVTVLPVAFALVKSSAFEVEKTAFNGGLTCDADETARVALRAAETIGEFIPKPATEMSIADCKNVILWLPVGNTVRGAKVSLPAAARVADWSGAPNWNIRIRNSEQVMWCMLDSADSDATFERTELVGAGLFFDRGDVTLRDLRNRQPLADYSLPAADRKLRFVDSKVAAWNFYAAQKARVSVTNCTFGEALTFGHSRMDVLNSTCDGTGGYLGATENSELALKDCKITCLVIAKDQATVRLERCEIVGDARATGGGKLILVNCRVVGRVEKDPGASIIQQP